MLICINLRLTAEWRKNYYFSSFSPGTPNQSNLSNRTWSKTIKALSQKTPGLQKPKEKKKEKINEQKCTLNWLARRTRTFTFLHRTGPRKTDRAKKFIVGKLSIRYYEHTWPIKTHQTSTRNAKRIEISLVVPGNCLIGLFIGWMGVVAMLPAGWPIYSRPRCPRNWVNPYCSLCTDPVRHISCSILLFQGHVKPNGLTN